MPVPHAYSQVVHAACYRVSLLMITYPVRHSFSWCAHTGSCDSSTSLGKVKQLIDEDIIDKAKGLLHELVAQNYGTDVRMEQIIMRYPDAKYDQEPRAVIQRGMRMQMFASCLCRLLAMQVWSNVLQRNNEPPFCYKFPVRFLFQALSKHLVMTLRDLDPISSCAYGVCDALLASSLCALEWR